MVRLRFLLLFLAVAGDIITIWGFLSGTFSFDSSEPESPLSATVDRALVVGIIYMFTTVAVVIVYTFIDVDFLEEVETMHNAAILALVYLPVAWLTGEWVAGGESFFASSFMAGSSRSESMRVIVSFIDLFFVALLMTIIPSMIIEGIRD